MPDTLGGIPLHPLVVHAVVVLVPLTAIGVILIAFVSRWRQRYGGLVALFALAALVATPIAKISGERFRDELGSSALIQKHADLGQNMLYFSIALFVVAVALWWVGRREAQREPYGRGLTIGIGVVSVIVAIAAGAWIFQVGHSGADAAWGGIASSNSGGG
jgi:uncharacterized membrane protein